MRSLWHLSRHLTARADDNHAAPSHLPYGYTVSNIFKCNLSPGKVPRYGVNGVGHNYLTSTYWLEDASYLRLKNVEVGYTFRQESLKKAGIGSIRIYVNGSNLLTWTDMLPGQDPEVANAGVTNSEPYPVTRVFNFGLNVNF